MRPNDTSITIYTTLALTKESLHAHHSSKRSRDITPPISNLVEINFDYITECDWLLRLILTAWLLFIIHFTNVSYEIP